MLALRNSFHLNFIDGIQIDTKTQNVPAKFVKNLLLWEVSILFVKKQLEIFIKLPDGKGRLYQSI